VDVQVLPGVAGQQAIGLRNSSSKRRRAPKKRNFSCARVSLVATRDNTFKPYLLTCRALHPRRSGGPRSLQNILGRMNRAACNQGAPSGRGTLKSSNGGTFAGMGRSSTWRLQFSIASGRAHRAWVFAGWDTTDPDLQAYVAGIHHPMGSYKRVSFGKKRCPVLDVNVGDDRAPRGAYTRSLATTRAITQPGSSGSPLFSGTRRRSGHV